MSEKTPTAAEIEAWDNATVVTAVPAGGSVDDGKNILIGLPTKDGPTHWYKFDETMLSRFIHTLRTFGEMAEQARAGSPVKNLDTITDPYRLRAAPRFGRSKDGKAVAVQFLTVEGIPLSIALPREAATAFADSLKKWASSGSR